MLTAYTCITRPQRAISSESDCRPRSHAFDPGLVPYFCEFDNEIFSTISFSSFHLLKKGCVSYKQNYGHEHQTPGNYIGHAPRINFFFCRIAYMLTLPLSEGLHISFCGNVVSGNQSLQNPPCGGVYSQLRPISGTFYNSYQPCPGCVLVMHGTYILSLNMAVTST